MTKYTTAELIAVANQEMIKWLPNKGWTFVTGEHISRLGHCNSKRKEIMVSLNFNRYNDKRIMRETVLHEIAHALVFEWIKDSKITRRISAHGWEWKRFAMKVGATPRASVRCNNPVRDEKRETYKWLLVYIDGNTVVPTQTRKSRFSRSMEGTWLRGKKRATYNNLYMVEHAEWEKVVSEQMEADKLAFHQSPTSVKRFFGLVAA
jgi:predicted SprT family Zn-dependent metalloprotease